MYCEGILLLRNYYLSSQFFLCVFSHNLIIALFMKFFVSSSEKTQMFFGFTVCETFETCSFLLPWKTLCFFKTHPLCCIHIPSMGCLLLICRESSIPGPMPSGQVLINLCGMQINLEVLYCTLIKLFWPIN